MKKIIIAMVAIVMIGVVGFFGYNYVVDEIEAAYDTAYSDGYNQGYVDGHTAGYEVGFDECLEEVNENCITIHKPGTDKDTEHLTFESVFDRFFE